MNLLIKNATIVDSENALNGKKKDILIENGIIQKIGSSLKSSNTKIFEAENLHVSIGWFDMQADFCDPGYEYKEDLKSGMAAATRGGFTGVAILPSDLPITDNKSNIEYIVNKTKNSVVDVHPYGAISKDFKGETLAEMYDMMQAGAVGFSDGKKCLDDEVILLQALLYSKDFNRPIISFPLKEKLRELMVFESRNNMLLGLKGFPNILETINVVRDISLAENAQSSIHLMPVCNKESVDAIGEAKKRGVKVSYAVSTANLLLNDEKLNSFDSNYKVFPPLLTEEKRKALIKAACSDAVDVLCSNHQPENKENKDLVFNHAEFGIINLQTSYAAANTALKNKISQEKLIEKITVNPRKILGLEVPTIKEGAAANLTLFNPELKWTFTKKENASKSENSPFFDVELIGKPLAVVNNNKIS